MTADLAAAVARDIEHECARLVLRFADIVDNGRFAELAEVFAPEGLFYRPAEPDTPLTVAALIDSYQQRLGSNASMHLVTNILITAESDHTASGSARILFFCAPKDANSETGKGRKATLHLVGGFSDRFVRKPQGWRFAQRRGEILFHV